MIRLDVIAFGSIKDQVRRKENERNIGRGFDQATSGFDVGEESKFAVGLARRAFAKRCAMNQKIRALTLKKGLHRERIRNVQVVTGQTADLPFRNAFWGGGDEFMAN